ncbi:uncharacterized protein TRIADDRAFT_1026, partial [Trichoplax adhaerens]
CRMSNCFNYSRCIGRPFKVYVYDGNNKMSDSYARVVRTIQNSPYYTNQPDQACLFVLAVDTLDRDKSSEDYVNRVSKISSHKLWNRGYNHIIFNLFAGTWPDYAEDLSLSLENAILIKASFSDSTYRLGFDISWPLFGKDYPLHNLQNDGRQPGSLSSIFPIHRKYKAAFKGKRYVLGIGSETRNALHHLHDDLNYIMVTTCKHGNTWREHQDSRCVVDELTYGEYDYQDLLINSTFCLVPRGRRLGSFRFLEALQFGCIPIVLSNGWVLPFSEVIDWKKACVQIDERQLFDVPELIESISDEKILAMKQQSIFLWQTYFQSVTRIVLSTLEIIRGRIDQTNPVHNLLWNHVPGALAALHTPFLEDAQDYPFYSNGIWNSHVQKAFTAIIVVRNYPDRKKSTAFYQLMRTLTSLPVVNKVWIHWRCKQPIIAVSELPRILSNISIVISDFRNQDYYLSNVSNLMHIIETQAILFLEQDAVYNKDEILFAFDIWRSFTDRLVGYASKSHYWNDVHKRYEFTSKWLNYYSIIMLNGAFIHRYYYDLVYHFFSDVALNKIQRLDNCLDIAINTVISYITNKPPVKLTQKKYHKISEEFSSNEPALKVLRRRMSQRWKCLNYLTELFGRLPLIHSYLRYDPLSFKHQLTADRKRHRQTKDL